MYRSVWQAICNKNTFILRSLPNLQRLLLSSQGLLLSLQRLLVATRTHNITATAKKSLLCKTPHPKQISYQDSSYLTRSLPNKQCYNTLGSLAPNPKCSSGDVIVDVRLMIKRARDATLVLSLACIM